MNYNTYNPTQLLQLCKTSPFKYVTGGVNPLITELLALVAVETDHKALINKMGDRIQARSTVSIAESLHTLAIIASIGKELDGDHDGLDALCYHLDGGTVQKAQAALQSIMQRFQEMTREQEERTRQYRKDFKLKCDANKV